MVERTEEVQRKSAAERPEPHIKRIWVKNLSKRFGDLVALKDFELEVEGGEFISLLGPSGCGKTTALNCFSGLLEPDAGDIELDGESILSVPPERRRFGMVFQNYALFPHLSIARNVSFGLEMEGVGKTEIRERVEEVLSLVHLEEHRDKYPAQLSGGQQQRVALARAVVTRPRVILMDEPLSNLDAKLRLEMRTEIRRLHQALGLTTIYVTHDQEEALSLSDRVVLMRAGTIQQVGPPQEVYAEPASAYAANFLGYRNLLPVKLTAAEGEQRATVVTQGGVELSGTLRDRLSPGDEAVAAIRPEDVSVLPADRKEQGAFSGTVELAEFLGRDSELSVPGELGEPVIVRTTGDWKVGSQVSLQLPPERLFVFAKEG